jgi:16S rRNA (adenine1518-N6/adenine1519-N6)-dimethyltransferase
MTSSPRQTLSYLRNLFEAHGIHPKSKLGQSFLIDLNLLDILVQAAELTPHDLALEVGSGTGSLTARLADQAGAVLSVEIDRTFFPLLEEAVGQRENVRLLNVDVLKNKNEINPKVLAALQELKEQKSCEQIKLVANLPYAVAVPVIGNLLISSLPIERMVVTVQWEIAERLLAEPGIKAYGALAVLVQSVAEVQLLRHLPPSVFWPRPQVASAMVLIRANAGKRSRVGDISRYRNFLRDLYAHRRKNLRGALAALPAHPHNKAEVDQKLAALGIDSALRAEMLDVEQHLRLLPMFG